ncbi:hypothetical protein OPKNFCMD_5164 [Methylobacterium crusticola]|uniref:Uncharacterized protein n=1 Tax=Methylobacterium crusticola TaxID=1697972 RepID=A0ABQ4R6H2_9HYPH|nr:hypothetical protein [Methylobacterium crusticola]GJD52399.1 hypothetical protein OPKNFCMD_5164 [Methylobacterium crusticola]
MQATMQVTNRAPGPRLFWVRGSGAPRCLGPGESAALDLLDRHDPFLAAWEAAGEVLIEEIPAGRDAPGHDAPGAGARGGPPDDPALDDAALRARLEARGIRPDRRWTRERLLAEARRGEEAAR